MDKIFVLLRVHQWTKNFFILFPLIFSGNFINQELLVKAVLCLVSFCCLSSSVYIFNDIKDRSVDRLHPKKKDRPLAAGSISLGIALTLAFLLLGASFAIGYWISIDVIGILGAYLCLHILYTLVVKNIVILDVFFIGLGFLIRVWAGSVVIGVTPTAWLQLCVFVLALFLGFSKRRSEITSLKEKAGEHRSALLEYNTYLLDQIILICAVLAIVFYSLYTFSPELILRIGSSDMIYSIGFVIFGLFRYLYLIHIKKLGEDPGEILLKDIPLLINICCWIAYIGWIIYWN